MDQKELHNTKKAFDLASVNYDILEKQNEIFQWMRKIIQAIYLSEFQSENTVLELNAGTGEDAIFLAKSGIKVIATDISTSMTDFIKSKTLEEELDNMISIQTASFSEIINVNAKNLDGVISNFGGLNCISEFGNLSKDVYDKLKPKGKFIAVVMNKICPAEILYYSLRLDFKNAFRRFRKNGIEVPVEGVKVRTYYYSPGDLANKFSQYFEVEKICSLGLLIPPPYLIGFYKKLKPVVKVLMKLDELIKNIFPFNRLGDHFIIIFSKKPN